MNESPKSPQIEWCQIDDRECLKFVFGGTFMENEAIDAIIRWKELFSTKKGEKVILVWQCQKMKSYEPMARILWQKAIKELKDQIDTIWLVADSTVIRAGAKIMALFTTFDLKVVNSEEKIKF